VKKYLGWFADRSDPEERDTKYPWQPFVQMGSGCLSLDARFETEEECMQFIRDEVLAHGIYGEGA